MNKKQLISSVATATGLSKVDATIAVNALIGSIGRSLVSGDSVSIQGFGTLQLKRREAKVGRNIKKNEPVHIPAHYVPVFKPSKELDTKIRKVPMLDRVKQGVK